jgi:uridine kinase
MTRDQVLDNLAKMLATLQISHPVRVAIDGIDASGKTTLANELAERLRASGRRVIRASTDNFHHPHEIRYRQGKDSPDGYYHDSFDYESILFLLLIPLGPDGNRRCKTGIYNYRNKILIDEPFIQVPENAILLFDGVFLLRPELYSAWDFRIFIKVDFDTALRRALARDKDLFGSVKNTEKRYLQRYFPGQRLYINQVNPEALANLIVHNHQIQNPTVHIRHK